MLKKKGFIGSIENNLFQKHLQYLWLLCSFVNCLLDNFPSGLNLAKSVYYSVNQCLATILYYYYYCNHYYWYYYRFYNGDDNDYDGNADVLKVIGFK